MACTHFQHEPVTGSVTGTVTRRSQISDAKENGGGSDAINMAAGRRRFLPARREPPSSRPRRQVSRTKEFGRQKAWGYRRFADQPVGAALNQVREFAGYLGNGLIHLRPAENEAGAIVGGVRGRQCPRGYECLDERTALRLES